MRRGWRCSGCWCAPGRTGFTAVLPARRRAMLAAARVDGLLNAEIAERFQVSVATVKKELQQGMQHCRARLADTQAVQRGSTTGRRKF